MPQELTPRGSLFGHQGTYTGSDDFLGGMARDGFDVTKRRMTEARNQRVDTLARLMGDVMHRRVHPDLLQEALCPTRGYVIEEVQRHYPGLLQFRETMSTSDFAQYLTVDVLNRLLRGNWDISTIPNRMLVKDRPMTDFRNVKDLAVDGGTKPFSKNYPGKPPDQRALTPVSPVLFAPDVYDGYMSINWRALVNDSLGMFDELLKDLAISGKRTIWLAITNLIADVNGPNALLYSVANGNLITIANGAKVNNPPLDFQGLADGRTILNKRKDADGYPIDFGMGTLYCWYGPDLEQNAKTLFGASIVDTSVYGGTTNAQGFPSQRLRTDNWVINGITPVMDKMIPIVTTAGTAAAKMWGLIYDPNSVPRPALLMGFLNEFANGPQLYQKVPNTMRAGGGVDAMMGDFYTMDQEYKGMTVFGTTYGVADGYKTTVASNGSGS